MLIYIFYILMVYWQVDISSWMGSLMSVREDGEMNTMKKSCTATVDVFNKYLKEQLMDIIDRLDIIYRQMVHNYFQ